MKMEHESGDAVWVLPGASTADGKRITRRQAGVVSGWHRPGRGTVEVILTPSRGPNKRVTIQQPHLVVVDR